MHYNAYTDSWGFGFRWSNGFVTTGFIWNNWWHSSGWYHPGPHHINCLSGLLCSSGGQRMVNINQINIGSNHIHIEPSNIRNIYNNSINFNRLAPSSVAQENRFNVAKDRENNLITDKDGNVYRRNKNQWERRDGKKWEQVSSELSSKGINKETIKEETAIPKGATKKTANELTASRDISKQHAIEKVSRRSKAGVPNQVVQDYHARQRGLERAARFDSDFNGNVHGDLLRHNFRH